MPNMIYRSKPIICQSIVGAAGLGKKTVGNRRCCHRVQVLEDIADTSRACGIWLGIIAYYLKKRTAGLCRLTQSISIAVRRLWRFRRSGMSHRGCRRSKRGRVERRSSRRTARRHSGIRIAWRTEILVARGEAKEPVVAISQVLDNPVLAGAMGEAGRQRAVERSCGTWYRPTLPIWSRACSGARQPGW